MERKVRVVPFESSSPRTSEMAPPRPLPALADDIIGEILFRLSPADPAHLFRTSLVCKSWRHLLSDPGFLRRYREFHHGTLPVLGFLNYTTFVSITSPACPLIPPALDCYGCVALDCRHGRVLLHTIGPAGLIVWDPITGNQRHLPDVPDDPYNHLTGAVLCAAGGCDHVDCGRGGPFLVVFGGTADDENLVEDDDVVSFTWLRVYSSETGTWSALASAHLGPIAASRDVMGPSLLAGGALYFLLEDGRRVLRYELGRHELSVMNLPPLRVGNMALVKAEDGGLGAAGVEGYSLHLWSWRGAAAGWAQDRVIELDMMLPMTIGDPSTRLLVIGYSEDANTIFIHSNDGIFAVEFKSDDRIQHICASRNFQAITPYTSFYTPDYARERFATAGEDAVMYN